MNAEVDVWHASPNGAYDNKSKNYHFRGQVTTNALGQYTFETLLPGIYASRPRHIHYKVRHSEHQELTTQLYFEGDKYLLTDITAKRNGGLNRAMPYSKVNADSYKMNFDIYLKKR